MPGDLALRGQRRAAAGLGREVAEESGAVSPLCPEADKSSHRSTRCANRRHPDLRSTCHDGLAGCSTMTGSVKENVEPCPTCDSTQIFPPCIATMRLEK